MSFEDLIKSTEDLSGPMLNQNKKKDKIIMYGYSSYLKIDKNNKKHYALISEDIYYPEAYRNLIFLLNSMEKDETIKIDISSPGGAVSVMNLICSAILRCKGTVITAIIGFAYSAGSMIWSCGHKLELYPGAHALFHMMLTSVNGRVDNISESTEILTSITKKMLMFCVNRGILAIAEYDAIIGKKEDIIIPYEELKNRIDIINQKDIENPISFFEGVTENDN